ncbi:MAG: head-tail adaptor protein [Mogibacterium sp.]|nr:head-tail adaptor protein [Mogibacterium sp.]
MLDKKITFYRRATAEDGKYGKNSAGEKYELVGTFNAAEDFNKGVKALRLGAVDAYDVVMFRMHYRKGIDRWCLIKYNGVWYEIESFNAIQREDQIQITAHERVNQKVTIVDKNNVEQ